MVGFYKKWNFTGNNRFTERAGLYYAAMFAEKQCNGNRAIIIFPTGYGFDMVIAPSTFNMNLQLIIQNGERFVEVKGDKRHNPNNFHISNTLKDLDKGIIKRLYVYLVYNVGINRPPNVAILEPNYLNHFATYSQHKCTFDIHGVGRDVKNGRIKNYYNIFDPLAKKQKEVINKSFRNGRVSSILECNLKDDELQKYLKVDNTDFIESNQEISNSKLTSINERITANPINYHKSEQILNRIYDEKRVSFLKEYLLSYMENTLIIDVISYKKQHPQDDYFQFRVISFFDYLSNQYSRVTIYPERNRILFNHNSYVYNTLWNDIINVLLSVGFIKSNKKGIYILKLNQ